MTVADATAASAEYGGGNDDVERRTGKSRSFFNEPFRVESRSHMPHIPPTVLTARLSGTLYPDHRPAGASPPPAAAAAPQPRQRPGR
jgi:hypothetical protein